MDILYIRIPKNASTSLYEAFGITNIAKRKFEVYAREVFYSEYCKGIFDPSHINFNKLVYYLGEEVLDCVKVCCVRNPYDRIVSAYCFAVEHNLMQVYGKTTLHFKEFVREFCKRKDYSNFFHAHSQKSWGMFGDEFIVDDIIKFEHLEDDYNFFVHKYNLDLPELPHKNKTKHADYSLFYDKDTSELVFNTYKEDFKFFNYQKEMDYEESFE